MEKENYLKQLSILSDNNKLAFLMGSKAILTMLQKEGKMQNIMIYEEYIEFINIIYKKTHFLQ